MRKEMSDDITRREQWLSKRMGKITSSKLDLFLKKGKNSEFSEPCVKYLYGIKRQRRTQVIPEEKTCYNFDWGHANECLALNWLRNELQADVRDCNADFPEIIFNEPFSGFGDSPDAFIYSDPLAEPDGVVEVKSPVDQSSLEQLWELDKIQDTDYFSQCLGHFIGQPSAKYCLLVIYDGYASIGKIMRLDRSEVEAEISSLTDKIKKASELVDESLISGKPLRTILC